MGTPTTWAHWIKPYEIEYNREGAPIIPNIWRRTQTIKEFWWYVMYKGSLKNPFIVPLEFSRKDLAMYWYNHQLKEHKDFKVVNWKYVLKNDITLYTRKQWEGVRKKMGLKLKLQFVDTSAYDTAYKKARARAQARKRMRRRGEKPRFFTIKDYTSINGTLYQNEVKDIMQGILPLSMQGRKF